MEGEEISTRKDLDVPTIKWHQFDNILNQGFLFRKNWLSLINLNLTHLYLKSPLLNIDYLSVHLNCIWLDPFLHHTVITQSFVQKYISQPSEVRLGQFKVRRTLVCVLWTRVLIFITWSDSPVPVWQSPWPHVVLKNDSILGTFWPKRLYFDSTSLFFFKMKIVMYLLSFFLVPLQVSSFKINSQCQCDTFRKSIFRPTILYFLVFFYAWHPYTPPNTRYGWTNRSHFI